MNETDAAGGNDPPDGPVVSLSIPEMDCPSCAGKVESALGRLDGVVETDTRPTTGTATVSYDPERVDENDLVAAIEGAGYEVTDSDAEDDSGTAGIAPPSAVWTSERAIKTWIGAALLTVGLLFEFVVPGWNLAVVETGPIDVDVLRSLTVGPLSVTVADALFLLAVVASGLPVVKGGYYSARNRSLDIDLLMGTAIVAATSVGLFVEAATLAVLFSIAELLEQYAMDQTRDSLRELIELAPNQATVLRDGEKREVPVDEVDVGEIVVVRPGEKIPVDGVVRDGESAVDQSPITGESVPVDKDDGDEVYAGTINEAGYLEIEASTDADGTTLARIIDLVRTAQSETTEKEQFVDRFAGYYTPAVVALALLTVVVPPLLIDGTLSVGVAGYSHTFVGGWRTWFVRGLTLLVIACPCAFVISTPVSVASGVTAAARNGVLIKGGNHLEAMGQVDAIAFDKTGTLTKGELAVTDVVPLGDATERDVLRYAGAVEQRSEHPIAAAILARSDEAGVAAPSVSEFESITGNGVRASVDGTTYYAGNPGLFEDLGFAFDTSDLLPESGEPRSDGGTPRSDAETSRSDGGTPRSDAETSRSDGGTPRSDAEAPGSGGSGGDPTGVGTATDRADSERAVGPDGDDEPSTADLLDPAVDADDVAVGDVIAALELDGKTVVLVGTEDRLVGLVGIADEIRPGAKRAVENLQRLGVAPLVMLTGDNEGTARTVAGELGIDEYRAELLPDEKVAAVEQLEDEYGDVAMIGDGINDAPALASASVSVAMGAAGTDTAIETADIALMGDDVGKLPYLYALSHKANAVIRQNIWSSLGVKLLLAVGVPFGYVSVAAAVVVGDMGMSLGVTGNAMRLSRMSPERFLE